MIRISKKRSLGILYGWAVNDTKFRASLLTAPS